MGVNVAGCSLDRHNPILVYSLIYLCVQMVRLPIIHINFPQGWSRNSRWHLHPFYPPTPQHFSLVAIFIVAIGAGAIKANVSPLISQVHTGNPRKVLKSAETVIDPAFAY